MLKSHFTASKYQKLRKSIILTIKILKGTYVDCVIGYIKKYMNENSDPYTKVVLQINGFYTLEISYIVIL